MIPLKIVNLRGTADLQKKVKVPVASDKQDTQVTDFQEYLQPVSQREGCLVAVMKTSARTVNLKTNQRAKHAGAKRTKHAKLV